MRHVTIEGTPTLVCETPSSTQSSDECLAIDTRLPQDASECAALQFSMDRHRTADRPAAHHHVTAPLTHGDEAEVLQRTNGLRPRDDR